MKGVCVSTDGDSGLTFSENMSYVKTTSMMSDIELNIFN